MSTLKRGTESVLIVRLLLRIRTGSEMTGTVRSATRAVRRRTRWAADEVVDTNRAKVYFGLTSDQEPEVLRVRPLAGCRRGRS
jgi:hypothetical protein